MGKKVDVDAANIEKASLLTFTASELKDIIEAIEEVGHPALELLQVALMSILHHHKTAGPQQTAVVQVEPDPVHPDDLKAAPPPEESKKEPEHEDDLVDEEDKRAIAPQPRGPHRPAFARKK